MKPWELRLNLLAKPWNQIRLRGGKKEYDEQTLGTLKI
jgi:hypothetical protein